MSRETMRELIRRVEGVITGERPEVVQKVRTRQGCEATMVGP